MYFSSVKIKMPVSYFHPNYRAKHCYWCFECIPRRWEMHLLICCHALAIAERSSNYILKLASLMVARICVSRDCVLPLAPILEACHITVSFAGGRRETEALCREGRQVTGTYLLRAQHIAAAPWEGLCSLPAMGLHPPSVWSCSLTASE